MLRNPYVLFEYILICSGSCYINQILYLFYSDEKIIKLTHVTGYVLVILIKTGKSCGRKLFGFPSPAVRNQAP